MLSLYQRHELPNKVPPGYLLATIRGESRTSSVMLIACYQRKIQEALKQDESD
jgi:hypothetical protein